MTLPGRGWSYKEFSQKHLDMGHMMSNSHLFLDSEADDILLHPFVCMHMFIVGDGGKSWNTKTTCWYRGQAVHKRESVH